MIKTKYKVAKYMRLSEQDGDKKESESIENQRDLIDNFIEKNEDLEIVGEYVDDGYTGANFDRPKFKQMIEDIENGKINCIITKDLSRFGRDHIDTGYYLERYLPSKNIRYISIGDRIDTIDQRGLQFLTFKLSYNDYYIQDISKKIKSVKKRKMLNGEYQSGIATYGYKKDDKQKNHLVIDTEVCDIVKEIFDMYANKKMSTIKIADELNERKIVPPAVYLDLPCTRKKSKNPNGEFVWLRTTIGHMLKNRTYLGHVIGGKKEQISPKIKKGIQKDKSEYIIVKNMHEPIIDEETWNKVQEKLNSFKHDTTKKYDYILKGLVYCKECGSEVTFNHNISRNKSGNISWEGNFAKCKKANNYSGLCKNKVLGEHILLRAIRDTVKKELESIKYTSKELKEIYSKAEKKTKNKIQKIDEEIEKKNKELTIISNRFSELYQMKLSKAIPIEEFKKEYEKINNNKQEVNEKLKKLQNEKLQEEKSKTTKKSEINKIKKTVQEFMNMENLNREIIEKLVEKIEFDKEKNITIQLTFSNPYINDSKVHKVSGKKYMQYSV